MLNGTILRHRCADITTFYFGLGTFTNARCPYHNSYPTTHHTALTKLFFRRATLTAGDPSLRPSKPGERGMRREVTHYIEQVRQPLQALLIPTLHVNSTTSAISYFHLVESAFHIAHVPRNSISKIYHSSCGRNARILDQTARRLTLPYTTNCCCSFTHTKGALTFTLLPRLVARPPETGHGPRRYYSKAQVRHHCSSTESPNPTFSDGETYHATAARRSGMAQPPADQAPRLYTWARL